jgi:hypothetical protein
MSHKAHFESIENEGFTVDQIFYIAIQFESSELSDFLEDMISMGVIQPVFEIQQEIEDVDSAISELIDSNKLGFVAKISVPKRSKFWFREDGSLGGNTVHPGEIYNYWVYADDMGTLIAKAIEESIEHRRLEIEEWKKLHQ